MTSTTRTQQIYATIDDYLGDGATRFFSRGYRRVTYHVTDIVATPMDVADAGAAATVTVRYPSDWSKKTDQADLRPHLSSVDVIILGAQLAETHLVHAFGLDGHQQEHMWLRRITLKAGTTPQEDLDNMPAKAQLLETVPTDANNDPGTSYASIYDCTIGVMKARLEIEHGMGARATSERSFDSFDQVLGQGHRRYFGEGFKSRSQSVDNVWINLDELRAEATVLVQDEGDVALNEGMGGAYQSTLTSVDCFVVNLQMAQVLMYELDAIDRRNSNTLWMLSTVLELDKPPQSINEPLNVCTAITGKHLLPLQGGTWRNVDITGDLAGISLRCSFAHELPSEAASAAT